jgi:hypothetical protein
MWRPQTPYCQSPPKVHRTLSIIHAAGVAVRHPGHRLVLQGEGRAVQGAQRVLVIVSVVTLLRLPGVLAVNTEARAVTPTLRFV